MAVLATGVWYVRKDTKQSQQFSLQQPHAYRDPNQNISVIDLKIFYVVPKNLLVAPNWKSQIESTLGEISDFHSVQFHNTSKINIEIYPKPIILSQDDVYYDSNDTSLGNPNGLRHIVPELETNYAQFLKVPNGHFLSEAIIYEGVGLAGSDGAMILSRTYLEKSEYSTAKASLFYHEFAHTFGLPDRFDLQSNNPDSDGVMGQGRYKPIETNYIEPDFLKDLGLANL